MVTQTTVLAESNLPGVELVDRGKVRDVYRAGDVKVWDLATRKELASYPEDMGVASVAFSPDGRLIASAGWDRQAKLREASAYVSDIQTQTVERARAAARVTDEYVHENPWPVIGAAIVVGFLAGLLVTQAAEPVGRAASRAWRQREAGRHIRPPLIFGHLGLAATGLVLWIIYLIAGSSALAWVAFVLLAIVAVLGFSMFALWLQRRQAADAEGIEPPQRIHQRQRDEAGPDHRPAQVREDREQECDRVAVDHHEVDEVDRHLNDVVLEPRQQHQNHDHGERQRTRQRGPAQ